MIACLSGSGRCQLTAPCHERCAFDTRPPSSEQRCEKCGGPLSKGVLDRSGQEYWCPTCAKEFGRQMKAALVGATLAIGALATTDSLAYCRSAVVEQIAADVKADLAEWRRLIGNSREGDSNG